ncbi:hypothetical protein JL722_15146 [Aureococcus anophagefferens]|nr:hypothetical protein JL722_15146 [Aureococcus anophagefferens]
MQAQKAMKKSSATSSSMRGGARRRPRRDAGDERREPGEAQERAQALVRDTSEGGHGACFTVTLPVGDRAIDGALGELEQSRSKAAGSASAVRRALSREEELLDEVRRLRNEVARHAVLSGLRGRAPARPRAPGDPAGRRGRAGGLAAVQGDGPSWASADAQKFHGRCVRRLEEHVEQPPESATQSLALLRKAHDCSIEDRRAKLGVEAELEATVARLEQVRVEVASRRKMDAVRKVYFDDMADRAESSTLNRGRTRRRGRRRRRSAPSRRRCSTR